jgi:hypothetical protein
VAEASTVHSAEAPATPTAPVRLSARPSRVPLPDRARLSSAAVWVLVPLLITVLCWRSLPLEPTHGVGSGLGSSWEAALHMALHEGITFGHHLIFTYGPLGFLTAPTLWYSDTGTIAVLYTLLLRFLLALALFAGARRTYGMLGGAIVAGVVAAASEFALETVPFLVFGVWMVDRVSSTRQRLALMAIGGGVAGLELLNKQSIGVEITALALIVALAARGRRRDHVIVTLSALLLVLFAGWAASGQDWGSLSAYARNSVQIISGYAAAMGYNRPGLAWQYVAGLLVFGVGLVGALKMSADGPARRRWGMITLWVAFSFFEYKEGFVRHDADHGARFFIALMGGFLAFRWRWGGYRVGLGLIGALFVFAVAAQGKAFTKVVNPAKNASSAITQLGDVISPSEGASLTARGRRSLERDYPIDQATLSLLRDHTVHVAPYATAVAWAYRLDWRPLPVFQSYAAFTTALDQADADALNSAQAPQRILRNLDTEIDRRVASFDEGLTSRTILCRYQELRTTEAWQVLGLGPNRCGASVSLGTVHAGWDQSVPVPAPPNDHSFVFARVSGATVGGLERLVALLYKPVERVVLLDGVSHRLVEATAADGLILRAPAGVDFSRPFKLAPDSSTIAVGEAGGGSGAGKPLTFSFFAQSVSSGPRVAPPPHGAVSGAIARKTRHR